MKAFLWRLTEIARQANARAHTEGHGCLACADRRKLMRRAGLTPVPALDWHGEPLPSGEPWAPPLLARRTG